MFGIVLASHGGMAEGLIDSANVLLGERKEQLAAVCLLPQESPEVCLEKLKAAVAKVDTGEGVIICCDLFGGTPCKMAVGLMSESVIVITGINLPMFLELLGQRDGNMALADIDFGEWMEIGKDGIKNLRELFNA